MFSLLESSGMVAYKKKIDNSILEVVKFYAEKKPSGEELKKYIKNKIKKYIEKDFEMNLNIEQNVDKNVNKLIDETNFLSEINNSNYKLSNLRKIIEPFYSNILQNVKSNID